MRGRLGSLVPALVVAGPGRGRHLHARDDGAAGGIVRDKGRDQRILGRELWAGRRAGRREHPVHRAREQSEGHLPLRREHARAHGARRSRARRERRDGGSTPRLARPSLSHSRRRGPRGDSGNSPLPHLPRRRDRGGHARLRPERGGAALVPDDARGARRLLLRAGAGDRELRLLGVHARVAVSGQLLVPLHRERRCGDGVLRGRHRGARRWRRRVERDADRPELCAHVLRSCLCRAGLGAKRGDLPDLPRPLPQREPWERSGARRVEQEITQHRSALRVPRRRPDRSEPARVGPDHPAALGRPARGLLPQLRRERGLSGALPRAGGLARDAARP